MVDLRVGEHQAPSPDPTLFKAAWRSGWREWVAVGVVVAPVAVTVGIVLLLR